MSVYRDRLRSDQQAVFDQACRDFMQMFADAQYERDLLAATEGPRAIALAAWHPGHRLETVDAIEAYYRQLQAEARRQTGPAAAGQD